jgi:AcrR family transcriptional regulator
MAQVKKPAVREAILDAAHRLFREQSYNGTTLS